MHICAAMQTKIVSGVPEIRSLRYSMVFSGVTVQAHRLNFLKGFQEPPKHTPAVNF